MRVTDLPDALDELGINPAAYRLMGTGAGDGYALTHQGHTWIVSVYERGERLEAHEFQTEEEACGFFIQFIAADVGTHVVRD